MHQSSRPIVSTFILIVVSPLLALGSLAAYSASDVHNTYDFLVPVVGVAQLVCIIGLFLGKLWGLIGYTATVVGLIIATFAYYVPKDETNVATKTSLFFAPLLVLAIYYWTSKRNYFR